MDAFAALNQNKSSTASAMPQPNFLLSRNFIKKNAEAREDCQRQNYQLVNRLFEITKQTSLICGPIQEIVFTNPFIPANFKLLEVDENLFDEITHRGGELVIRGNVTDVVVACTKTRTYQIKEVETSNSFLLLPLLPIIGLNTKSVTNDLEKTPVSSITKTYLEIFEMTSTFSTRLRTILLDHVLELNDENELSFTNNNLLTRDFLLNQVQLSEAELISKLRELPVIECEDRLSWLSTNVQQKILDEVIERCDDLVTPDITTKKFTFEALQTKLQWDEKLRSAIITWFIRSLCDNNDDCIHFSLNEKKVCRARAIEILSNDKKKEFPISQFKKMMERVLPNGFDPRLDCLGGIAYFDENLVTGKTIRSLNVEDLPMDVHKRLQCLFGIRKTWKKEDIEPYIMDFCKCSSDVEAFLLKHCRIVKKNDDKYFTLKLL